MSELPPPPSTTDHELESEESSIDPGRALLVLAGIAALIGAGAVYTRESSKGMFDDEPNYALALLLLGAGAYIIMIAAILSAGRRR